MKKLRLLLTVFFHQYTGDHYAGLGFALLIVLAMLRDPIDSFMLWLTIYVFWSLFLDLVFCHIAVRMLRIWQLIASLDQERRELLMEWSRLRYSYKKFPRDEAETPFFSTLSGYELDWRCGAFASDCVQEEELRQRLKGEELQLTDFLRNEKFNPRGLGSSAATSVFRKKRRKLEEQIRQTQKMLSCFEKMLEKDRDELKARVKIFKQLLLTPPSYNLTKHINQKKAERVARQKPLAAEATFVILGDETTAKA